MGATSFSSETPTGKILAHLQRHGEATIKDLESVLGVTTTAVREHLANLQTQELVTTKLIRRGPGRPRLAYSLTQKAHRMFPKAYDSLINTLLHEIIRREGSENLQTLLDAVGSRLANEYRDQISGEEISERLTTLRTALESRGIPTEIQGTGDGFQMFACPYHDVAQEHPGVCMMEQRMLEEILGESIQIKSTIREGHHSCKFHVATSKANQDTSEMKENT